MPGCLESSEERPSNFDCNRKGWMPNPARQLCGEFCFYRARRFAVALAVTLFDRTGLRGGGLSRSTAERFLDRCSQPNHQSTRPRPGPQFQAMDTAPEPAAARAVPPALERSRPIAGTAAFVPGHSRFRARKEILPRPPVPDSPECRWQARIGLHPLLRAVRATIPPNPMEVERASRSLATLRTPRQRHSREVGPSRSRAFAVTQHTHRRCWLIRPAPIERLYRVSRTPRLIDDSSSRAKILS